MEGRPAGPDAGAVTREMQLAGNVRAAYMPPLRTHGLQQANNEPPGRGGALLRPR